MAYCAQSVQTQCTHDMATLANVPVKRGRTAAMAVVNTTRIKSCHKKSVTKKKPSNCRLCGRGGHQATGNCELRKELGSMTKDNNIDTIVNDLTCCNSPVVNHVEVIPVGSHIFQQVHLETSHMVLHNYATIKTDNGGIVTSHKDTSYLCVTQLFDMGNT